jgi:hypothetical protein
LTNNLPLSTETGALGLYHLKRLWAKTLWPALAGGTADEWRHDSALLDMLGIGLLPTFDYLHSERPAFEAFEQWVLARHGGSLPPGLAAQCNALQDGFATSVSGNTTGDVLTAEDLAFWEANGYVIVRRAVGAEDCAAARAAIWDYLGMDEHDPATWYRDAQQLQGIMVPLYRHPAIDKNRQSPVIRRAFEQLWGHNRLLVTTDKAGFNPPETPHHQYRGVGLHWDVSLVPPIPFGVQGILYLTDTAAHQGALTVVPGFHRHIDQWLAQLPPGTDPRRTDFAPYGPVAIAANAGDCIIWHHALPHGASPNRADGPRLVQYLYWYAPQREMAGEWV